ncbi:MAG TPA: hypothetical protein DCE71_07350 [Parachlamydiales bacterium]|nr:hypothetical protein [Parachlamydiales bacterium]
MQKFRFTLLLVLLPILLPAQSTSSQNGRAGESAGYATRDATVLSMMGWGVGLAAGIAALCALVHNDTAHTHS